MNLYYNLILYNIKFYICNIFSLFNIKNTEGKKELNILKASEMDYKKNYNIENDIDEFKF